MTKYEVETKLGDDKTLTLKDLPFETGEILRVVVSSDGEIDIDQDPHHLQGSVLYYKDPFEPACPLEDWEALR